MGSSEKERSTNLIYILVINLATSIVVIGKKASGKSVLSKRISEQFKIPIASFGGYLKSHCESHQLSTDIKNLQDLGEKFIQKDSSGFIQKVIEFSGKNPSVLLFDGVRHLSVLRSIRAMSERCMVLFIDVDQQTRFKRFMDRQKDADHEKNWSNFIEVENHPVEREIDSLKTASDKVYSLTIENYDMIQSEITDFLKK